MYSLGYTGIGGKVSSGFGKFEAVITDVPEELLKMLTNQNADRYITLSVCMAKEDELESCLKRLKEKPKFVVTDSQAVKNVANIVDESIKLTTFSTLFARYKGDFKVLLEGANKLDCLKDGDKILISEGCTHHRQCNDIGTVKLPNWIKKYTNKNNVSFFKLLKAT
mgnify:CR=1 FL=1